MRKPWVIGLFSIVPGLGFAVLGQVRMAVVLFALTVLLFLSAFVPVEVVAATGITLGVIAWITQGYYAIVLAQRSAREEAGLALPTRQVPASPAPQGASSEERYLLGVNQTVAQLLQPDENLRVALQGATGAPSSTELLLDLASLAMGDSGSATGIGIRQVYLGLTDEHLVLVKTDPFGKPSEIQRTQLSHAYLVKSSEGMLSDEVIINVGEATPLRITVGRPMRQATRQLVEMLSRRADPAEGKAP